MGDDLISRLWSWSVHTGDSLFAEAAEELDRVSKRAQAWEDICIRLAEYHEHTIEEMYKAVGLYLGKEHDAATEPPSTP